MADVFIKRHATPSSLHYVSSTEMSTIPQMASIRRVAEVVMQETNTVVRTR